MQRIKLFYAFSIPEAEGEVNKWLEEYDEYYPISITTAVFPSNNNAENYDKIIEMFEWEVNDVVDLEQKEFNEYVQDETEFAIQAKYSNSFYNSSSF